MSADVSLFVFTIFDGAALLFLSIYSLITLSDLECDYINVKECCIKLNRWIIPEYIAFLFLLILFLITKHWILISLHIPIVIFMTYQLKTNTGFSIHFYDGILMQNNQILKKYIKASMIKLINHLIFFFIYLYNLIMVIITDV